MAVRKITLELSEGDLARIRAIVFRELREAADAFAAEVDQASQPNSAAGEEALGIMRFWLQPTADLLDRIVGWGTRADLAQLITDERRQRVDEVDREIATEHYRPLVAIDDDEDGGA